MVNKPIFRCSGVRYHAKLNLHNNIDYQPKSHVNPG